MDNNHSTWLYCISTMQCTGQKLAVWWMNVEQTLDWQRGGALKGRRGEYRMLHGGISIRAGPLPEDRGYCFPMQCWTQGIIQDEEKGMTFINHSFFFYWLSHRSIQAHWVLGHYVLDTVLELEKWSQCGMTPNLMLQIQLAQMVYSHGTNYPGCTWCIPVLRSEWWAAGHFPSLEKKKSYLKQQVAENGLACVLLPGSPISPIPFAFKQYQKYCSKTPCMSDSPLLFTYTHSSLVISVGFYIGGKRSVSSIY